MCVCVFPINAYNTANIFWLLNWISATIENDITLGYSVHVIGSIYMISHTIPSQNSYSYRLIHFALSLCASAAFSPSPSALLSNTAHFETIFRLIKFQTTEFARHTHNRYIFPMTKYNNNNQCIRNLHGPSECWMRYVYVMLCASRHFANHTIHKLVHWIGKRARERTSYTYPDKFCYNWIVIVHIYESNSYHQSIFAFVTFYE